MEDGNVRLIKNKYKPVVLLVLDGFGVNMSVPESTWKFAKRPTFEMLETHWPFTALQASGIAVGIPWNEAGNSEIGHLTIGAGRVLYHHLPRIISSIDDGSFFENPAFLAAAERAKKPGARLHLMGLFSSGSVHAYVEHLYALLDFAKRSGVPEVYLHLFGDGKDAPPKEMLGFLKKFKESLLDYPNIKIASVIGRFYSMDRDENWDRIEAAYRLLTEGRGKPFIDPVEHVAISYEAGLNDTTLLPGFLEDGANLPVGQAGLPLGRIQNGDAVIFYNFREDSVRELTSAFVSEHFDRFARSRLDLEFVTMTEYEKGLPVKAAFLSLDVPRTLAGMISDAGLRQLHIAEMEKYAHVTYFFNGGKEKPFPGEDRILVPSSGAANYDEHPEMSTGQVADAVLANLDKYDFILANFANCDMVGHTGNFDATVKAIEVVDFSVGKIVSQVLEMGGALIVTADHGNAEEKRYRLTGEKRTKHTTNPVPCFLVANEFKKETPISPTEIDAQYVDVGGVITDIAPTVLKFMGLNAPNEMTGSNLIDKLL
ncbi:MAG: 2,3-bisphosphoglycerate-independent phosphoglycerate mutase [Candidatus Niyogibacteria bacterium]|nr:2,3-bisphosphoglycerate-independent phosphoglycerate mutase [Candidatus Niyogibacteria bacterium]